MAPEPDPGRHRGSGTARAVGIGIGLLADAALGDPRRAHPVAAFGRWAGALERVLYRPSRASGALFTATAAGIPVALGVLAERAVRRRPILQVVLTAVATWAVLGGRSLAGEGTAMAALLEAGDLDGARGRLGHLCSREPAGLADTELARATVESLAENASDAVVAPLLWGAFAGLPGMIGYRAVNTLDAMVGYRSVRYRDFGWASARLDDVANLVPARLTGGLTVALAGSIGGSPRRAWQVTRREAAAHPSPNAGWCEAAAAGALGVRLGGVNSYAGNAESRPVLGAAGRQVTVTDIRRMVRLGGMVAAAAGALAAAAAGVLPRSGPGRLDGRG